jgi:SAM-dependent methyltransferase
MRDRTDELPYLPTNREDDMNRMDYEQIYREAQAGILDLPPGWEIQEPQPVVIDLNERGCFKGSVLDAGCGTGEHAVYLAQNGHEVTGIDSSKTAVDGAREKAKSLNLAVDFQVRDVCADLRMGKLFDRILDCGLLHSLDNSDRRKYTQNLAQISRPGAVAYVLSFSTEEPGDWGPYRLSETELAEAFEDQWKCASITEVELRAWRPDTGNKGPVVALLGEFVMMIPEAT